jgi:hypothetical protein
MHALEGHHHQQAASVPIAVPLNLFLPVLIITTASVWLRPLHVQPQSPIIREHTHKASVLACKHVIYHIRLGC